MVEVESDSQLPFLNVLVRCGADGSICIVKARTLTITSTLNPTTLSPTRSLISTLLSSAATHSSDPEAKKAKTRHILPALKSSGYLGPLVSQQALRWGCEQVQ